MVNLQIVNEFSSLLLTKWSIKRRLKNLRTLFTSNYAEMRINKYGKA